MTGACGRVLGIDAGYSAKRATTGFCCMAWDPERIVWRCRNSRTAASEREAALDEVLSISAAPLRAAAVDGPLRPGLIVDASRGRAADSLLSRGVFAKRGKPGHIHAGSGPELHRHATLLALMAKRRDPKMPVGEAFPNLFYGVMCPEAEYPPRPEKARNWTDTLVKIGAVQAGVLALMAGLLPGRVLEAAPPVDDHEEVAAFACAATALGLASGRSVAVGEAREGAILLSPLEFWSEDGWAERALVANRNGLTQAF